MARPLHVGHAGSSWAFGLRLGLAIVGSLYAALLTAAMLRAAVPRWWFFPSGHGIHPPGSPLS